MKTIIKASLSVFVLLATVACSSVKTNLERLNEVTQKINAKDYTIGVNYANPMRGKQIYLNFDYDLRIKNDSAFAYLPYYGVVSRAPYGGGKGGIKFAEPMKEYSIAPNKKNDGWDIRFKVDTPDYNYDIMMNVFNDGSSLIKVNSFQRDPISFSGAIKGLKSE
ncbi:DUF4251 domain-containing protein [Paludibacter sp. 221]|uniref:DUF4251 domain-containing protein n=1 Tax=Paludibacter sp. 221 TaxID=2302939 RepID=UPI0013D3A62E|nr:DUF4251 domain-containing protein [Paludibacter sp. 221]NDV45545.1 DUF4251 domain-containing protein [Paludibacter sp. 221]